MNSIEKTKYVDNSCFSVRLQDSVLSVVQRVDDSMPACHLRSESIPITCFPSSSLYEFPDVVSN